MDNDVKVPIADAEPALGMSALYRLFEAFIALREKNERQHKLFEQSLNRTRDGLQSSFNTFAADTMKAYQQLRQDMVGEKKFSLALLNELLDQAIDLDHILATRPQSLPADEAWQGWNAALEVQNRKVQDVIARFGISSYDAIVGTPYHPALHERVGSRRVEGIEALKIAEQRERGYASQQPEFILRRPKVIVTE
jgi:molecular chaperone GrpE (heat shock protein)